MQLPAWVAYLIVAVAGLGIAGALLRAYRQQEAAFAKRVRLPGPLGGWYELLPGAPPLPPSVVAQRLEDASIAIVRFGPWPAALVRDALRGVGVQVAGVERWQLNGQTVEGHSHPSLRTVMVGPNLLALCHECIHLCESAIDGGGAVDYGHSKWDSRGLRRAEADYEDRVRSG